MTIEPKKPSFLKRALQNLALFFGVFLLCIFGLEIALRICGYGNLEIYQPDPKLYWRLKPDQDCYTKIDHKPVHINSHSTRGPEFQIEKPANTIRILSLGDSRTFGWGLSDGETYSRLLERSLRANVGDGRHVEVINAGVNAWSYPQMLVYFRDFALQYKPDYVILGEANLWTQFSESNSPEFVRQFMSRVRLKNFLRHFAIYHYVIEVQLKDFYERNRTKFIPVDPKQDTLFKEQQQTDPNAVFRTAIENLCRLAQTNGVNPVLLYIPTANDLNLTNTPAVQEVKTRVHDHLNVPLVDLTEDLKPQGKALYLEADPVHLNSPGNEIVARRLFETMTNLMAR
jgi:lysophospholipase L1-like esterase